ncbi:MAG TPA: methenyltetrahydrofolate cyclohydrolase [Chloroflexi bacterium]|nr:methenyltetrahydrofolate cyclohydrolase [Chloroflexota bacterium]
MRAGEPEAGFLDRLAEGTPTPGGGSAAAHAGAMGAALVAMVGRLTLGKKKYAEVQEQMEQLVQRAEALRRHLQEAVELDAQAFEGVMQAFRMPKGTEAEKQARREAIEQATHKAAEVPLQVCRWCAEVVAMAADAAALGNRNAVSDAGSGAAMAGAGFQAAAYNVRINATSVSDRKAAQRWLEELEHLEAEVAEQGKRVRATLDQALNPS